VRNRNDRRHVHHLENRAQSRAPDRIEDEDMLGIIAAVLVVMWLLGFLAFHVAGGLIHLLLVVAVIMIVLQFITGRRAV
jgi:uncharacterized membrane protein